MSSLIVEAGEMALGAEARLARAGIREHDSFLGHEMRGPAGTGRGGVSWLWGGRADAQGREMG